MARKIIILDQVGGPADFRVAFWLDVPAARQPFYVNANATSEVIGASVAELDAIRTGKVVEAVQQILRPNDVGIGALRTLLQAEHARLQNNLTTVNPWARYGTSWDGATWTPVTVA